MEHEGAIPPHPPLSQMQHHQLSGHEEEKEQCSGLYMHMRKTNSCFPQRRWMLRCSGGMRAWLLSKQAIRRCYGQSRLYAVFSESPDCRRSWLQLLSLLAMQIPSSCLWEMTAPCWMWTGTCSMWHVFWDKVKQAACQITAAHKNAVKCREQFI